jgi:hypothetical protein
MVVVLVISVQQAVVLLAAIVHQAWWLQTGRQQGVVHCVKAVVTEWLSPAVLPDTRLTLLPREHLDGFTYKRLVASSAEQAEQAGLVIVHVVYSLSGSSIEHHPGQLPHMFMFLCSPPPIFLLPLFFLGLSPAGAGTLSLAGGADFMGVPPIAAGFLSLGGKQMSLYL